MNTLYFALGFLTAIGAEVVLLIVAAVDRYKRRK